MSVLFIFRYASSHDWSLSKPMNAAGGRSGSRATGGERGQQQGASAQRARGARAAVQQRTVAQAVACLKVPDDRAVHDPAKPAEDQLQVLLVSQGEVKRQMSGAQCVYF